MIPTGKSFRFVRAMRSCVWPWDDVPSEAGLKSRKVLRGSVPVPCRALGRGSWCETCFRKIN